MTSLDLSVLAVLFRELNNVSMNDTTASGSLGQEGGRAGSLHSPPENMEEKGTGGFLPMSGLRACR